MRSSSDNSLMAGDVLATSGSGDDCIYISSKRLRCGRPVKSKFTGFWPSRGLVEHGLRRSAFRKTDKPPMEPRELFLALCRVPAIAEENAGFMAWIFEYMFFDAGVVLLDGEEGPSGADVYHEITSGMPGVLEALLQELQKRREAEEG